LEDVQLEEEADMGGFKIDIRKVGRKVCVCGSESCQKLGIHISGSKFSACVFTTMASLFFWLLGWLDSWLFGGIYRRYSEDDFSSVPRDLDLNSIPL
jgi:hypothetical protein